MLSPVPVENLCKLIEGLPVLTQAFVRPRVVPPMEQLAAAPVCLLPVVGKVAEHLR